MTSQAERDEDRKHTHDLDQCDSLAGELAAAQEELARRTHTLDLCRQELGGTREEADRFAAGLATMRAVARSNKRHVAILAGILDTIDELHQPHTNSVGHDWCKVCNTLWPCRTSQAIGNPAR